MARPRAFIAMSCKQRAREVGMRLATHGWDLVATLGTAASLRACGAVVQDVEELSGVPVLLGGRAKTLDLSILGGLLWRRGHQEDDRDAHAWNLVYFDLVALDFKPRLSTEQAIETEAQDVEWIDVGGPAVVRAAAKNYRHVAVLVGSAEDEIYLDQLDAVGGDPAQVGPEQLRRLAVAAFERMSAYDQEVISHLRRRVGK